MTSVSSSMFTGLMSTMSETRHKRRSRGEKVTPLTKALVANVKVPEVYPKIVGRDVGFLIRVD